MRRSSSPYVSSFSFGPGPLSTTLKALIGANVVMFVAQAVFPVLTEVFGLHPAWVIPALSTRAAEHAFWLWQPATYMFLHGGVFHILFNMLALWMFGAELERIWGTRYFLKFYFVTGIGAGVVTVILSLLPFGGQLQYVNIIGASGAIYGLLLAFAMYFPDRPILLVVFPVPAKVAVTILGAIALFSSLSESGGVANATHLSGLVVAYFFLKGARLHPLAEVKYRYLKWKINHVRKKFDVYSGGRANDFDRRVH
ncbi:MAG TPA: rhomboid family intramembrane serine protease [Vicinamibacterales bacterium]|jgi:membrane associated rhomboid family serine protease|nr:rhomboid family intramembrane serine protease [Vicinamibacterales bacterium]